VKSFQCKEDGSIESSSTTLSVFVVGFKVKKKKSVKEKREDNKKKIKREKERNASFEIDSKKYSFV